MTAGTLGEALAHGLLAGGVGTTAGALPALLVRTIGPRLEAALAGFSAGVMLTASFVALLLPALEIVQRDADGRHFATWPVLAGVAAGALAIQLLHRRAPHEHFATGREHAERSGLARVWLLAIALSLHNVPEGLAVGVGVASGDATLSWPITWAIAVQNAPEGLIVAVAFVAAGQSKGKAFAVTVATGLVEPLGALLGFVGVSVVTNAMPPALAFAAGAMLWVVSHEIIPESHRAGRSPAATFGVVLGVLAMLQLDAWLG